MPGMGGGMPGVGGGMPGMPGMEGMLGMGGMPGMDHPPVHAGTSQERANSVMQSFRENAVAMVHDTPHVVHHETAPPQYVQGESTEVMGHPVHVRVDQEQAIAGQTQQHMVEKPTVQVVEQYVDVPEVLVQEKHVEVPQIVHEHTEHIVHQAR